MGLIGSSALVQALEVSSVSSEQLPRTFTIVCILNPTVEGGK